MKIYDGVEMLEISANVMGKTDFIHPTLLWDNDTALLADTGFPGQLSKIREAMDTAGVPFDRLNKVFITHHDIDHIGSLASILGEASHPIEVLAHVEEKPHIQGEKPILKLTPEAISQMENRLSSVPEEHRKAIISVLQNPPKAKVDKTVADGDVLPYCGGITVIHTPGHTPGHICLYHKPSKTLIAGDAMAVVNGQLFGPNPQFAFDIDSAKKSVKKLRQFDIQKVICYHGGLYQDNPNQRIAELANA